MQLIDPKTLHEGAELRRRLTGETDPVQGKPWLQKAFDEETEHVWAAFWTRPGLSLRDRAACTLACLVALGHDEDLVALLAGVLRNQLLTPVEIRELILHCTPYAGTPRSTAALRLASALFNKEGSAS